MKYFLITATILLSVALQATSLIAQAVYRIIPMAVEVDPRWQYHTDCLEDCTLHCLSQPTCHSMYYEGQTGECSLMTSSHLLNLISSLPSSTVQELMRGSTRQFVFLNGSKSGSDDNDEISATPRNRPGITTIPNILDLSTEADTIYRTSHIVRTVVNPDRSTSSPKPTTILDPTTEKQTTLLDPTTEKQTTLLGPTTEKHTTLLDPTTEKQTTLLDPTTEKHTTLLDPTTEKHTTLLDPTTEKQTTLLDPTTEKQTTLLDPTTEKHTTLLDPTSEAVAVSTHASTPRFTTVPFVPPTTPEVETTTEDNYVIDGCPVTSSQLNDIEMVDYEERIVSTANVACQDTCKATPWPCCKKSVCDGTCTKSFDKDCYCKLSAPGSNVLTCKKR